MCSANPHLDRLFLVQSLKAGSQLTAAQSASIRYAPSLGYRSIAKSYSEFDVWRWNVRFSLLPSAAAMDEDFGDVSFSLEEDDGVFGGSTGYISSSSEGEDSDIDVFLNPFAETDLPLNRERLETPDAALTLTAHRLATIQRGYQKNRKLLVPMPPPYGLVHLGNCYRLLTVFCFVAMTNSVDITDGADGLVGGVSALALIGMSIAVLPICPDLAVFGASIAGASVGFLFHNRYKASILMGDVGSLGLGGALSAMAACTGMFFPLLIASGFFILEALSVVLQVVVLKATIRRKGAGRLISKVAPLHQLLKLYGLKVPLIVACAYALCCILAISAGYIGLVSA